MAEIKTRKLNGPLISLNYQTKDLKKSSFMMNNRVVSKKLQTIGLIPSNYYKPISKLCIVI